MGEGEPSAVLERIRQFHGMRSDLKGKRTLTPALSHRMGEGEPSAVLERIRQFHGMRSDLKAKRTPHPGPLPSDGRGRSFASFVVNRAVSSVIKTKQCGCKTGLKLQSLRADGNVTGPYAMARHQEVPRSEAVRPFPYRIYRWTCHRRAASGLAIHHTAPPGCRCIGGLGDWRKYDT